MNIFQKIAALFGAQYIGYVHECHVEIRRAKKIGRRWVIADTGRIIAPQGKIHGTNSKWEPYTPKVERFYKAEML